MLRARFTCFSMPACMMSHSWLGTHAVWQEMKSTGWALQMLSHGLHAASSSAGLSWWGQHQPLPPGSSGPLPQRCPLLGLQTDCAASPLQSRRPTPDCLDAAPVLSESCCYRHVLGVVSAMYRIWTMLMIFPYAYAECVCCLGSSVDIQAINW